MDSEDDMHDANDLESMDDDFYSGDTGMGSDNGDGAYDFGDNESDGSEDIISHRQQVREGLSWFASVFFYFYFSFLRI